MCWKLVQNLITLWGLWILGLFLEAGGMYVCVHKYPVVSFFLSHFISQQCTLAVHWVWLGKAVHEHFSMQKCQFTQTDLVLLLSQSLPVLLGVCYTSRLSPPCMRDCGGLALAVLILSLVLLQQEKGRKYNEEFVVQDKDKGITQKLLSWSKQTQLGEPNIFLNMSSKRCSQNHWWAQQWVCSRVSFV